jgi:peroxiredoxin
VAALQPGTPFPSVALLDANGRPQPPATGEVLYAFFKTTCPTCELAWPFLDRIRAVAEGGSLRVLAVSQDAPDATLEFNERLSVAVPTLYDPKPWTASEALGLTNVPTLFHVDGSGRIRDTVVGFQKEKMEELGALAAQRAGRAAQTLFRSEETVPALRPG